MVDMMNGTVTMTQKETDHRTEFGKLLEEYRTRAGLSQDEFARQMRLKGYPNFGQRMVSHITRQANPRVYPCFFQMAGEVLGLDFSEQQTLLISWISTGAPMNGEDAP